MLHVAHELAECYPLAAAGGALFDAFIILCLVQFDLKLIEEGIAKSVKNTVILISCTCNESVPVGHDQSFLQTLLCDQSALFVSKIPKCHPQKFFFKGYFVFLGETIQEIRV